MRAGMSLIYLILFVYMKLANLAEEKYPRQQLLRLS
nr:MAG TPA: hypothetical protein [Caudoviricetes sp.]